MEPTRCASHESRGRASRYKVKEKAPVCPTGVGPQAKDRPLPEFFVGRLYAGCFGLCFGFWLAFEADEGVFEHFGDAAVAGFGCAAIEKAEQPAAGFDRSHVLPTFVGAGIGGGGTF